FRGPRLGAGEEVERAEELRERLERVRAAERVDRPRGLGRAVEVAVVGDVLPHAVLARAAKPDHGRPPRELAGDGAFEAVELVALDGERQVADEVVEGHRVASTTANA